MSKEIFNEIFEINLRITQVVTNFMIDTGFSRLCLICKALLAMFRKCKKIRG
jgi:hypothetical protein